MCEEVLELSDKPQWLDVLTAPAVCIRHTLRVLPKKVSKRNNVNKNKKTTADTARLMFEFKVTQKN